MVRTEGLSLTLGSFSLQDISIEITQGEYLVLLGPTGAGKTVLVEAVAGVLLPDRGKIMVAEKDVTRIPPEKRRLGIVYQDYALFPHMNVYNNIAFGLRLRGFRGTELRDAVVHMAGFLNLGHMLKRKPGNLSGGERQRVAIARALVLDPIALLLDEPLAALDRLTKDRLLRELKRIHLETGITILHITHDLNEAFFLGDRIAIMNEGRILQQGVPRDVLENPANRFVAELLGVRNVIPARSEHRGEIEMEGLGRAVLTGRPPSAGKSVYVTVPDWAVELHPGEEDNRYSWKGDMRITSVLPSNGNIEIELEHRSGTKLRTSLSKREAERLQAPLQEDKVIGTGIMREGMNWVPAD